MSFFESLMLLMLAAVLLLQVARRLELPYPAMLAGAGVLIAFLPGAPTIFLEPNSALALFIAPVVLDAAFDFPPGAVLRFISPLLALVVFAVLATTAIVAYLGHSWLGLPVAAAVVLGAIVAPPDAAAASAVLTSVSVPRTSEEVLKGESLFNDATALLLYSGGLAVQAAGGLTLGHGVRLGLAVPGGILLGVLWGLATRKLRHGFQATLGGNVFQFVGVYLLWLLAERLEVSAVLSTIAAAMTLARSTGLKNWARMRVQSYAVWSVVVFTLNVLAFLFMGMQARSIVRHMSSVPLLFAVRFAGAVVATVILTRLLVVVSFNRMMALIWRLQGRSPQASVQQAIFVGWSGMRGFVTLATAFALPTNFPQRDTIVLTAFAVVLGTLVFQGLTLRPLIGLLRLSDGGVSLQEVTRARGRLAGAALHALQSEPGAAAEALRFPYQMEHERAAEDAEPRRERHYRELGLRAVAAERDILEALRDQNAIGINGYLQLQEEIDWRELTMLQEEERRIEEA